MISVLYIEGRRSVVYSLTTWFYLVGFLRFAIRLIATDSRFKGMQSSVTPAKAKTTPIPSWDDVPKDASTAKAALNPEPVSRDIMRDSLTDSELTYAIMLDPIIRKIPQQIICHSGKLLGAPRRKNVSMFDLGDHESQTAADRSPRRKDTMGSLYESRELFPFSSGSLFIKI
ncbi:hypothetical protein [Corynebacterium urogenitale]|uniref:hypothetical protein n=1 Tax=Corynebacterium urogenitale TaxID=2487892 RepID=UPI00125FE3FD|nr:hypothetical protein [Corynebacterium urogenitale]